MILGIESSCDESALAVFDPERGVIENLVYSQIQTHQAYGGIVPELASREHLEAFVPLLDRLRLAVDLKLISKIAVTAGPGLASCLALGIAHGRSLSLALDIPLVGVNHLRGHVYSPFISLHETAPDKFNSDFQSLLPHLGLIVSGGNTVLFKITTDQELVIIGETIDDAAGEALDKGAKLLGMQYPGGPLIEKEAAGGRADRFDFPRGMVQSSELKFSFSGLKTSLRYCLEKLSDDELEQNYSDICASYQKAVVDALILKTRSALKKSKYQSLGLSGGVANNLTLRSTFQKEADKRRVPLLFARSEHTGDNAAMIAFAGWINPQDTLKDGVGLVVRPNWKIVK